MDKSDPTLRHSSLVIKGYVAEINHLFSFTDSFSSHNNQSSYLPSSFTPKSISGNTSRSNHNTTDHYSLSIYIDAENPSSLLNQLSTKSTGGEGFEEGRNYSSSNQKFEESAIHNNNNNSEEISNRIISSLYIDRDSSHSHRSKDVNLLKNKNQIELLVSEEWSVSLAFLAVGDIIEVKRFDVQVNRQTGLLVLLVTVVTEILVTRQKAVAINWSNVGRLELLDLTEREIDAARKTLAQCRFSETFTKKMIDAKKKRSESDERFSSSTALSAFSERNSFSSVARYYDIIFGDRVSMKANITFIREKLGDRVSVLDAGCGTGLCAFALRSLGLFPVCMDFSECAEKIIEEKNEFFLNMEKGSKKEEDGKLLKDLHADESVHSKDLFDHVDNRYLRKLAQLRASRNTTALDFFRENIVNFRLCSRQENAPYSGKNTDELPETSIISRLLDFECVLALRVLSLLRNRHEVELALKCLALHTKSDGTGIAIVSFPNADRLISHGDYSISKSYKFDKCSLNVGATPHIPSGDLHIVEVVTIRTHDIQFPDRPLSDPERVVTWHGTAFHPSKNLPEKERRVSFVETFTELLLPLSVVEEIIEQNDVGFTVKEKYGSLSGDWFYREFSDECVFVLQRRKRVDGP